MNLSTCSNTCFNLCVGGIISFPWFSKELKMIYRRTTGFVVSTLYFSFVNQYSLGGGFPFSIVLVPRYKLSSCHTPIKPDLLGFPRISVFACGLRDHVITRFASMWFKNVVPRHSFLLSVAVQQKLTTQDRLHRFGIHGPNRCSLCLHNNEDHNHLFFECSYTAIWWDVCDRCNTPRMTKGWDEWIRWATFTWHGKSFINFSRKLGFAATVYYIWQERDARNV